jgi:hypothetical protein
MKTLFHSSIRNLPRLSHSVTTKNRSSYVIFSSKTSTKADHVSTRNTRIKIMPNSNENFCLTPLLVLNSQKQNYKTNFILNTSFPIMYKSYFASRKDYLFLKMCFIHLYFIFLKKKKQKKRKIHLNKK